MPGNFLIFFLTGKIRETEILLNSQQPHERMKGCAGPSFITVHALPVVAWEKSVTARTADDLTGPPF